MSAPHNSHGNHVTEYRACDACFAYSLVLDGLCLQCTLQLRIDWDSPVQQTMEVNL